MTLVYRGQKPDDEVSPAVAAIELHNCLAQVRHAQSDYEAHQTLHPRGLVSDREVNEASYRYTLAWQERSRCLSQLRWSLLQQEQQRESQRRAAQGLPTHEEYNLADRLIGNVMDELVERMEQLGDELEWRGFDPNGDHAWRELWQLYQRSGAVWGAIGEQRAAYLQALSEGVQR